MIFLEINETDIHIDTEEMNSMQKNRAKWEELVP